MTALQKCFTSSKTLTEFLCNTLKIHSFNLGKGGCWQFDLDQSDQ
ncbi:hypothetical protein LLB_2220 [Legionella longbeachae D-4968]|nr:hypothetical protein LLB_2220 [Legionella longbeachae D-4968]